MDDDDLNLVRRSRFSNTYGGLDLTVSDDGEFFLRMRGCFGVDIFGPLTEKQIGAFNALVQVKNIEDESK